MNVKRRTFLKGSLAGSALVLAAGAGLLKPGRVLAAEWPKKAFDAKTMPEAISSLFGSTAAAASKDIMIKAPLQAENGAVVPITVSTKMDNVESIGLMVEKNATPLVANVALSNGAAGYFSARMKMGRTSNVTAFVKAGGKLYSASQEIKVTVGGCGG